MSDISTKQDTHPAHNMKGPTYPYHNDVLNTTPEQRNTQFTYDTGDEKSNRGQGPTNDNAPGSGSTDSEVYNYSASIRKEQMSK